VIREFVKATDGPAYLNFSGVEFYGPGEFRLTPIKRGLVRFDPLAEILADRDYDVTVISSSPLLEHDAMYMKLLYERALTRRWSKLHAPPAPRPPPKPAAAPPGRPPPKPKPAAKARPSAARPSGHRPKPRRPAHAKRRTEARHGGHRRR